MNSTASSSAILRAPAHWFLASAGLVCFFVGCTSPKEYVDNGFKVGPNYATPPAPVAQQWIEAGDKRVRTDNEDLSKWWTVFNDPVLNDLICEAYQQNLTLRQAGFRVLEARAQLGIAIGTLFPQTQDMSGAYNHTQVSKQLTGTGGTFDTWNFGFNLAWELDFWGRFRRAVEADTALLNSSVEDFDDVLVTLLGDIASNYVQMRTFEQRIAYAKANVEAQRETLRIVEARLNAGTVSELDADQARSVLAQTEALIPEFEISLQQTVNQLCILLGIPPEDLRKKLGPAPIPGAPVDVAAGVPANMLERRPDIRRAERQAAAQCALIGVAESEFYPHISINGSFGYAAQNFGELFRTDAFQGSVGPSFQWNLLNYGRILNNVRLQDAKFQELVIFYQNTVLRGAQEVENGLVTFLKAQERTRLQAESVNYADKALKIAMVQYTAGRIDFTRVTQLQTALVLQQDQLAQAQGEIALGLIQVYRALGGGWEIRCTGCPNAESSLKAMPELPATKVRPALFDAPSSQQSNARSKDGMIERASGKVQP